jgi:serine protease AprX
MRLPDACSRVLLLIAALLSAAALAPGLARAATWVPPGLLEGAAANPTATAHLVVVAAPGVTTGELKNKGLKTPEGRELAKVRREFEHMSALAVDVRGADLLELSRRRGILSITPDGSVQGDSFAPLPLAGVTAQPWILAVGAHKLWSDGAAPTVAIVDSGVGASALDFGSRVTDRQNFSSFKSSDSGGDDLGHGTLVAGIAAGGSSAYRGVAPNARIASLRVVSANGRSITSDVLEAAEWIYKNRVSKGIGVVNLSIRSTHANPAFYDPINIAVERLWRAGVVVVASAGNGGSERMLYAPASSPFVITVGAVGLNGTIDAADDTNAPWSSHGYTAEGFAKPELAAPGRSIVGPVPIGATLPLTFPSRIVAPGYMWMSGTSFAAPIVAGAAAQLLGRHPGWSPDQVKGALMLTARALPLAEPLAAGVGEIDVAAAASLTSPPNPNERLYDFVRRDVAGRDYFDVDSWNAAVSANASWTSASWTSASWTSASWTSASWTGASWTSAGWSSAAWSSGSWTSGNWSAASWTSASWTSASWTSASWTGASWTSASWTSATGVD